jgi:hypothetical protein
MHIYITLRHSVHTRREHTAFSLRRQAFKNLIAIVRIARTYKYGQCGLNVELCDCSRMWYIYITTNLRWTVLGKVPIYCVGIPAICVVRELRDTCAELRVMVDWLWAGGRG